jgi:hypothetical protein
VEGDRSRAAQFLGFSIMMLAAASVLFVLTVISSLNLAGVWSGPTFPIWAEPAVMLPMMLGVFALILYPTQYPVTRRIGISAVGVRLVFPLRSLTLKWPTIRWIGPNYLDASRGLAGLHVRLTPTQVERITRFLQHQ